MCNERNYVTSQKSTIVRIGLPQYRHVLQVVAVYGDTHAFFCVNRLAFRKWAVKNGKATRQKHMNNLHVKANEHSETRVV